ncbi:MAG: hypothetical protein IPK08_12555 [Bacteroidetes bacterium]|nr:hypothetical protein [Bacteroidota bacterium]
MLFVAIAAPILFPLVSFAQDGEVILPLYHNKALQQSAINNLQNSFKTAATDTLKLPFFDDFSTYTVWPNADLWSDSSAFVNFNFPINPQLLGWRLSMVSIKKVILTITPMSMLLVYVII